VLSRDSSRTSGFVFLRAQEEALPTLPPKESFLFEFPELRKRGRPVDPLPEHPFSIVYGILSLVEELSPDRLTFWQKGGFLMIDDLFVSFSEREELQTTSPPFLFSENRRFLAHSEKTPFFAEGKALHLSSPGIAFFLSEGYGFFSAHP